MMKTSSIVAVLALVGAGWTTPTVAQDDPIPHCESPRECEVMWSAAQEAVGLISTMRNRLVTDTRIETYPPMRGGDVGAIVTKVPAGASGYDFRIRVECRRDCSSLAASGTKLFNTLVGSSAISSRPATTSAPAPALEQAPARDPPAKGGESSYTIERMPEAVACNAAPRALLTNKGAGFESYTVMCASGDSLSVRCQYGNCRVLK